MHQVIIESADASPWPLVSTFVDSLLTIWTRHYLSRAGVYVGCMYQEYASVLAAAGSTLTAAAATGTSLSFMVGRCAYTPYNIHAC